MLILLGANIYPIQTYAIEIKSAVLRVDRDMELPISRVDIPPEDVGFAGAELAIQDNQTTGQFLGHKYDLETIATTPEMAGDVLTQLIENGNQFIVVIGNGKEVVKFSEIAGDRALILNAGASEVSLRDSECRKNVIHIVPSRAMKTDALAQFLIWKKWNRWVLIHGSHPEDHLLKQSYLNSAKKFGASIVEEREFEDTGGARRTDSGHAQVQRQIPLFSQDLEEHDIIIAADENDVFSTYIPFHTWEPSLVAGSAGLIPVTWHHSHEAWGATQLQRRFEKLSNRPMRELDYQVWLGLRVVGEAVTRISSGDLTKIRNYLLGPEFNLAAFKGTKVTFRPWNGQLRQPILLNDGRITVSVSPQDGFLHQRSQLDTMGLDEAESNCESFK